MSRDFERAESRKSRSESDRSACGVQSRFLQGLGPQDLELVLAAATHRQLFANSVVTTQDHLQTTSSC
jgi:hypothetical protein